MAGVGEKINAYRDLVRKNEEKRQYGRPRRWWKDTKWNLNKYSERACTGFIRARIAPWRCLVKAALKLPVRQNDRNLCPTQEMLASQKSPFHGVINWVVTCCLTLFQEISQHLNRFCISYIKDRQRHKTGPGEQPSLAQSRPDLSCSLKSGDTKMQFRSLYGNFPTFSFSILSIFCQQ